MKTTKLKCDCGCRTTVEKGCSNGWFTLTQKSTDEDEVKICDDLHFKDIFHLAKWALKANEVGKSLQEGLRNRPSIRGMLSDKRLPSILI